MTGILNDKQMWIVTCETQQDGTKVLPYQVGNRYTSQQAALQALWLLPLQLRESASIVPVTADGKQLLNG